MNYNLICVFSLLIFVNISRCEEIASKLNNSGTSSYDTIVVGLGTSGLAAVKELSQHGKHVLGLEAADRYGGRVHTVDFGDGVVELGAEWIHGRKNSGTYELAVANNISVLNQEYSNKFYRSNGTELNEQLMNDLVENCFLKVEAVDATPEIKSLGELHLKRCNEYISKTRPDLFANDDFIAELYHTFRYFISDEYASDSWYDVSVRTEYENLDEFYQTSWHRHGYRTLLQIILNKYNNGPGLTNADLKLNKEVTQIVWSQDPESEVTVKCKDGSKYSAKNVIVTVSLGVLKHRRSSLFTPILPQNKIEAIENISMGLLDKIILKFDEVWWPTDVSFFVLFWQKEHIEKISEEDAWITNITDISRSMGSDKVLVVWLSGSTARKVEKIPENVIKGQVMKVLRLFMGSSVPEPSGIIKTGWFNNSLTHGSYSFDNVRASDHREWRRDLATPLLDHNGQARVLFAGEATNVHHYGTVHGALETGVREAMRIIANNYV